MLFERRTEPGKGVTCARSEARLTLPRRDVAWVRVAGQDDPILTVLTLGLVVGVLVLAGLYAFN